MGNAGMVAQVLCTTLLSAGPKAYAVLVLRDPGRIGPLRCYSRPDNKDHSHIATANERKISEVDRSGNDGGPATASPAADQRVLGSKYERNKIGGKVKGGPQYSSATLTLTTAGSLSHLLSIPTHNYSLGVSTESYSKSGCSTGGSTHENLPLMKLSIQVEVSNCARTNEEFEKEDYGGVFIGGPQILSPFNK